MKENEYLLKKEDYEKVIFEHNLTKIDRNKLNNYQKFLYFLNKKIEEYIYERKFLKPLLFLVIVNCAIIKLIEIESLLGVIVTFVTLSFFGFFSTQFFVLVLMEMKENEEKNIISLKILKNQKDILRDLNDSNLTSFKKEEIKSYLKEHRYEKDYGYQKLVEKENILKIKSKIEQEKEIEDIFK